jgi:hypothetical protein
MQLGYKRILLSFAWLKQKYKHDGLEKAKQHSRKPTRSW